MKKLEEFYIRNKRLSCAIKKVIEVVKNYKIYGLEEAQLFPIKDFNNRGTKESFLPNVDAYNNIIASIGKLRVGLNDSINIYHDEQKQFSEVLIKWTEVLKEHKVNVNKLKFHISKDDVMVQIADFYTGYIARLYKKIVDSTFLDRSDREVIKILKPLLGKCNIVAPNTEQEEFFKKCGLRKAETPVPFLL